MKKLLILSLFGILCIGVKAENERMYGSKIQNEIFVENNLGYNLNGLDNEKCETKVGYKFSYRINRFKLEISPTETVNLTDPSKLHFDFASKLGFKF